MHPKQNAFTTADSGKLALGEGSHMGRKQGLQGAGRGLGRGLEGRGGAWRTGLPPLKHSDILGCS